MHDFVSVNGLGGGMELGFVQAGMRLIHRAGSLSLGAPVVEGNRPIIGWDWNSSFSADYREWPRMLTPIVMGNPPCSAWSTLTRKDLRGGDAAVMKCTAELIDYAGILPFAPYMVAIESVQQAFSTGRKWYQEARDKLSAATGYEYDLVWVMQSNATLGGCSVRKRVFVVYTRIPFGVEYAQPARVARLGDAIRDLEGLKLTMEKQAYRRPATWWTINRRAEDGVDGHYVNPKVNDPYVELWNELSSRGIPWRPGQSTTEVLRTLHSVSNGKVPMPWMKNIDKLVERDFDLGLNQTGCWDPEKQSQVVTGRGPDHSVHYAEPRLYTYRECARIQGFPDTWQIWPARNYNNLSGVWGKGVPVDAGRWIGRWMKAALDGEPGTMRGEPMSDASNERMIQLTNTFKQTLNVERLWEHERFVPHEEGHWVDRDHDESCCL